jgi:GNAT superfamily N-acetyltransferase
VNARALLPLARYDEQMARLDGAVIEPVGADLVALAQAHALDATVFPHSSLPLVFGGQVPVLWIARAEYGGPVLGFVGTRAREGVLEISGLAVTPAHQREGLGRALVRAAVRAGSISCRSTSPREMPRPSGSTRARRSAKRNASSASTPRTAFRTAETRG